MALQISSSSATGLDPLSTFARVDPGNCIRAGYSEKMGEGGEPLKSSNVLELCTSIEAVVQREKFSHHHFQLLERALMATLHSPPPPSSSVVSFSVLFTV